MSNTYQALYITSPTNEEEEFNQDPSNPWPVYSQLNFSMNGVNTVLKLIVVDMDPADVDVIYESEDNRFYLWFNSNWGVWYVYDNDENDGLFLPSDRRSPPTKELGVDGGWLVDEGTPDPADLAISSLTDPENQLIPLDENGNVWYEQLRRNRQND